MCNATGYPQPTIVLHVGKTKLAETTKIEVKKGSEYRFVANNAFDVAIGDVYYSKLLAFLIAKYTFIYTTVNRNRMVWIAGKLQSGAANMSCIKREKIT